MALLRRGAGDADPAGDTTGRSDLLETATDKAALRRELAEAGARGGHLIEQVNSGGDMGRGSGLGRWSLGVAA